jgi:hypothetical protein
MSYVVHGVWCLFIQTSCYTGPVFGLGPFDTDDWVSDSDNFKIRTPSINVSSIFTLFFTISQRPFCYILVTVCIQLVECRLKSVDCCHLSTTLRHSSYVMSSAT